MKLLLIEDDPELSEEIEKELSANGYLVDTCLDGETGLYYALNPDHGYDLAMIDRMLPIVDGLTIVRAMREKGQHLPVILITGMSALYDRIDGLDGGADDYLVKPFYMEELLARIRALTRRPREIKNTELLTYADLCFNREDRTLSAGKKSLALTAREGELLSLFLAKPNTLFTRERLILTVWGAAAEVETGNVDNYISFLRKRLRELGSTCQITTVYGAGYKLEDRHAGTVI